MSDGLGVGYGARPDADGIDAVYFVAQENYPVEFLELGYPVRLLRYSIHRDSGGAGRFRGGCGDGAGIRGAGRSRGAVDADRQRGEPSLGRGRRQIGRHRPRGVNPGTAREVALAPLSDGTVLRRGDMLLIETGGGGGHGHPFDRPAEQVAQDIRDGFVSVEAARREYGVVVRRWRAGRSRDRGIARPRRPAAGAFHRREYVDAIG